MCMTAIRGSSDLCSEAPGGRLNYHREKMGVKRVGDGFLGGVCDCKGLLDNICSAISRVITENPLLKSKNNSPRTWDHNVSFHVLLIQQIIWYIFQSSRTWATKHWTWVKLDWRLKQHYRTCQYIFKTAYTIFYPNTCYPNLHSCLLGILLVISDCHMINFDKSN